MRKARKTKAKTRNPRFSISPAQLKIADKHMTNAATALRRETEASQRSYCLQLAVDRIPNSGKDWPDHVLKVADQFYRYITKGTLPGAAKLAAVPGGNGSTGL